MCVCVSVHNNGQSPPCPSFIYLFIHVCFIVVWVIGCSVIGLGFFCCLFCIPFSFFRFCLFLILFFSFCFFVFPPLCSLSLSLACEDMSYLSQLERTLWKTVILSCIQIPHFHVIGFVHSIQCLLGHVLSDLFSQESEILMQGSQSMRNNTIPC